MKTRYILPALLVLGTVVTTTQATAELSYDPVDNYYGKYYGIGVEPTNMQTKMQENTKFSGACTDYYNTYYSSDKPSAGSQQVVTAESTDAMDMADPRNYYMW